MEMQFGYIKNKEHRKWALEIEKAAAARQKTFRLFPEVFNWLRDHFNYHESVTEINYNGTKFYK